MSHPSLFYFPFSCWSWVYFALLFLDSWELCYCFETSSLLIYIFSAINFPLITALGMSHKLYVLYFHFHWVQCILMIFLETCSLTPRLFQSVWFSFQIFEDFHVIFLLWLLFWLQCIIEHIVCDLTPFKLSRSVLRLIIWSYLLMFCKDLKWMYILMLLGEMFYKYQLDLFIDAIVEFL